MLDTPSVIRVEEYICSVRPDGHTDHSTLRGSGAFHIHPCFGLGVGEANLVQRRANLKRVKPPLDFA